MTKEDLIKLIEDKILQQQNFIDAVKPISWEQQILCDQAKMQYLWFIEKIKNINEATVKREHLIDFFNMVKPRASELAERNTEDVVDFYLQKSIK